VSFLGPFLTVLLVHRRNKVPRQLTGERIDSSGHWSRLADFESSVQTL